ncbi:hypothetical protein MHM84_03500 [Halomonas sp. McH1-25]|uniref:hypothetical protein n=1 Tax=unclassified Halomonas TaxID=2609666 RepID=UPI001EF56410|nr:MULTISPECIES: hypothetical protein [unclassified Halomonas]MCG7598837.1 hypothetical protein [Halomonas sp. McH1-25]MCP1340800.1 hypothetical protein [Halomonas sp. FL8]MCP1362223.1 hypothetical protein [Halomonas sp. BBD45]MCP1364113.1 hypothetical protein [Halomonas sp. BBD48]
MDPLDPRLRTYRSKDGSMERTLLPEIAALIYSDWIEVGAEREQAHERRDLPSDIRDCPAADSSGGELPTEQEGEA